MTPEEGGEIVINGGSVWGFRTSRNETSAFAAFKFLTRSLQFRPADASIGVDGCSGKSFVFPQHGHKGFDALEETGGSFLSMPQWQTRPLQHAQAQWLEAAEADIQPLLWVNG